MGQGSGGERNGTLIKYIEIRVCYCTAISIYIDDVDDVEDNTSFHGNIVR